MVEGKVQDGLIEDVLRGRLDVVGLAERGGVGAAELGEWALDAKNRRVMHGLCVLADLQTQVLLSRYRMVAAGRLIKLATDEGESGAGADVARRACVDLLKLDLKRADGGGLDETGGGAGGGVGGEDQGLLSVLMSAGERDLLRVGVDESVVRSLVYGGLGGDREEDLHKEPPGCAADTAGE